MATRFEIRTAGFIETSVPLKQGDKVRGPGRKNGNGVLDGYSIYELTKSRTLSLTFFNSDNRKTGTGDPIVLNGEIRIIELGRFSRDPGAHAVITNY